jgi:hypothetical protein
MQSFLLSLVMLALVTPFGVFEPRDIASGEIKQDRMDSCLDEESPTSEAEVEDAELFYHGVLFFEHHVQIDGRLPAFQGNFVLAANIDPQGCRPPPVA